MFGMERAVENNGDPVVNFHRVSCGVAINASAGCALREAETDDQSASSGCRR
jgi:hypothetical protein